MIVAGLKDHFSVFHSLNSFVPKFCYANIQRCILVDATFKREFTITLSDDLEAHMSYT